MMSMSICGEQPKLDTLLHHHLAYPIYPTFDRFCRKIAISPLIPFVVEAPVAVIPVITTLAKIDYPVVGTRGDNALHGSGYLEDERGTGYSGP